MIRRKQSIAFLLPSVLILLTLAMSLSAGPFLGKRVREFAHDRALEHAEDLSNFLMHVMEAFRGDFASEENIRKIQRVIQNVGVLPSVSLAYVIGPDFKTLARNDARASVDGVPPYLHSYLVAALQSQQMSRGFFTRDGLSQLIVVQPVKGGIYNPQRKSSVLALGVLIFDLSEQERQITALIGLVVGVLTLCGGCMATVIYLLVRRRVIGPLKLFQAAIEDLGRSDLRARAPVVHPDEIGAIAGALNETVARLNEVTVSKMELEVVHRELIAMQSNLIESSKLASLGQMAGGIAHEINSPLAIIQLRAGQLRSMSEEGDCDPGQVGKIAVGIEATTVRIAKIVKALRAFARDGRQDPTRLVSIKSMLAETLELCSERFKKHGIRLELDLPETDDDVLVHCRAIQISQVLLNLLNNAHDAIEKLPEKWIRISVFPREQSVQIQVTDSGPGIPPELRTKVLEPFFTTKPVGKGTGLGLSVSKSFVESHHGQLYVDGSCPNTRFVVELPKQQPDDGPVSRT